MEQWDGKERRNKVFYCDAHSETRETLVLLTNNLDHLTEAVNKIDRHLEEASKTRVAWWLAIASIIVGVLVQTFIFSYYLGSMGKQIETNTGRLDMIERKLFHEKTNP